MKLIKILSLNVRGLRNHVKRRALFLYLKNQKADFYCLQETFSLEEDDRGVATCTQIRNCVPENNNKNK